MAVKTELEKAGLQQGYFLKPLNVDEMTDLFHAIITY